MTTTATADIDDLASRIAQTLRETSADPALDGEGAARAEVTAQGFYMPWDRFGRGLILTGEWLRTRGGPGPTVPASSGGEALKLNWLGLVGCIFIAIGKFLLNQ